MSPTDRAGSGLAVEQTLDWRSPEIAGLLERALAEDIGSGLPAKASAKAGDLTTDALFPSAIPARGTFVASQVMVVAGLPLVEQLYARLDPGIQFRRRVEEGEQVSRQALAEVEGDGRTLLRSERTALNFLQRLSGIATLTRRFVARLEGTQAQLRDTRKTTPGLRQLEKYAVRVGGGTNHRFGLFDAVLIKENHVQLAGGVAEAVRRAKAKYSAGPAIEVEVRDPGELEEALRAGAGLVLLDNMTVEQVDLAVEQIRGRARVEVSGGIRLENIRAYAAGPPPMVDATLRMLLLEGRLTSDSIRYDKFS